MESKHFLTQYAQMKNGLYHIWRCYRKLGLEHWHSAKTNFHQYKINTRFSRDDLITIVGGNLKYTVFSNIIAMT